MSHLAVHKGLSASRHHGITSMSNGSDSKDICRAKPCTYTNCSRPICSNELPNHYGTRLIYFAMEAISCIPTIRLTPDKEQKLGEHREKSVATAQDQQDEPE